MERTILFRGRTKAGKWLEGLPTYNFNFIFNKKQNESPYNYEVDPETVGEFTGLTDKNGVKIFEGDILKVEDHKPIVVGWSEKFASFVLNRKGWAFSHWFGESCNPEDCEVVGNIHDNPEMMEVK